MNSIDTGIKKLEAILKNVCDSETSYWPKNWTKENPLYGHCAVASMIVQDYFGGDLIRGSLKKVRGYGNGTYHYWNRLPNGKEVDITSSQFPEELLSSGVFERLVYRDGEKRNRKALVSISSVSNRYRTLKRRVERAIGNKLRSYQAQIY